MRTVRRSDVDDFHVDLIGTATAVSDGDVAVIEEILEGWVRTPHAGNAIVVDRATDRVDVLASVPWDWTGAAPVGGWAVAALALRLSRELPAWRWTLKDEPLGGRSLLVAQLFWERPAPEAVFGDGALIGLGATRPGVLPAMTCTLLSDIDRETGLGAWIGVPADAATRATKRAVEDRIRTAFAGSVYPGHDATDCFWPEPTAYFRGKHWTGHTPRDLRYHSEALSYMGPAGFAFFLPAFMLAELDNAEQADIIAGSIAFHLTQGDTWGADERVALLSAAQRSAVVAFLDYVEGTYGSMDTEAAVALLEQPAL